MHICAPSLVGSYNCTAVLGIPTAVSMYAYPGARDCLRCSRSLLGCWCSLDSASHGWNSEGGGAAQEYGGEGHATRGDVRHYGRTRARGSRPKPLDSQHTRGRELRS